MTGALIVDSGDPSASEWGGPSNLTEGSGSGSFRTEVFGPPGGWVTSQTFCRVEVAWSLRTIRMLMSSRSIVPTPCFHHAQPPKQRTLCKLTTNTVQRRSEYRSVNGTLVLFFFATVRPYLFDSRSVRFQHSHSSSRINSSLPKPCNGTDSAALITTGTSSARQRAISDRAERTKQDAHRKFQDALRSSKPRGS
jgi:hypothetical protein